MKKNQFPLEIFPANIMEFVDEANKCYGYNKDFFASAIPVSYTHLTLPTTSRV